MKARFLFYMLSTCLLVGCGNSNSEVNSTEQQDGANKTLEITQKAIEGLKYSDYVLSEDAEKVVANWINYQELETQIGFLKKLDFSFFKEEEAVMKEFITSLKESIPDNLNTNSINARLTVVETTLLRLNNNLRIENLPTDEKLESIKAFLEAVSNLNYLINKKLEFDKTDIGRPQ